MIGGVTEDVGAAGGQTRGFLFADLRGYTDFVERRGDDAAAGLLERYRTLVRGVVARHTGAEVKTEGDSFYVLFPSASSAVAAGLDIVASAAAESAEHPDAPIRVGVGVHAGETSQTAEGPVGSAVNIAARICAQAAAGEVLVSDTVRGLTRTRQVADFEAAGARRLKGIAEPMTLYRVMALGAGGRRSARRSLGGARPLGLPPATIGLIGLAILVLLPVTWIIATALGGGGGPTAAPTHTLAAAGPSPSPAVVTTPGPTAQRPVSRIIFSRHVALADDPADPYDVDCNGHADAKLYAVDPSGQAEPYRISTYTNLFEFDPSWSSDGNAITFLASIQNRGSSVEVSHLPWTDPLRLNMGARPQISADGSEVLVVIEDRFEIARADGSALDSVVLMADPFGESEGTPLPSPLQVEGPLLDGTWGPNGRILLVPPVAFNPDGPPLYKIELRDRDGSNPTTVPIDVGEMFPLRLALSPDGQTLALALADQPVMDQEAPIIANGIYLVPMSGGQPSRITPAGTPVRDMTWSPDGREIAYTAGGLGATQIWRVSADGGTPTQVTHMDDAFACGATWQSASVEAVAPPATPEPGQPATFERGILAPGTYLITESQPNVEVTMPSGFWSRRNYVDGFSIAQIGGEGLAELDSALITVAFTGPCIDDPTTVVGPTAREVIAWLQARADLDASAPVPVNFGGYHGLSTEVTLKDGCPAESEPGFERAYLFPSGQDIYHIVTGERIKLIVVDVRGTAVAVLVDAIGDAYEPFAQAVQPILDSISFPD